MKKLLKVIGVIILIPVIGFSCFLLYGAALWILGYEISLPPWDLAEKLVKEGRPAKDCYLYRAFDFGPRPSDAEQQAGCVHEYAKLAQDPFACELIMPSPYGMDCVGGAMKFNQCNFRTNEVTWAEDGESYGVPYGECDKFDPKRSPKGNACCTMAQVAFVKSKNDCSSLASNIVFFDECQFDLGVKSHDPVVCDNITDQNVKAGCLVMTKALKKNPSICADCTQPVDDINELK